MPSIEELLQQGWLKHETITQEEVDLTLERAHEELAAAQELAGRFPSSAYELGYNAMLLAVTALLYSDGYRARMERHHRTLVDFAEARLGMQYASLVNEFERTRRKRHRTIYGQMKATRYEVEHVLQTAKQLIAVIERLLWEKPL